MDAAGAGCNKWRDFAKRNSRSKGSMEAALATVLQREHSEIQVKQKESHTKTQRKT